MWLFFSYAVVILRFDGCVTAVLLIITRHKHGRRSVLNTGDEQMIWFLAVLGCLTPVLGSWGRCGRGSGGITTGNVYIFYIRNHTFSCIFA